MNKTLLTAIHVDDDPRSLELMRLASDELPELELKASFTRAEDALEYLKTEKADLAFLDIEMPGKGGLWLAGQLLDLEVEIIFVTAHAQYALAAFEACALDYLIKPVDTLLLQQMLDRCRRKFIAMPPTASDRPTQLQLNEFFEHYIAVNSYPRRIFVSLKGYTRLIRVDELIYLKSEAHTTTFFLKNGEEIVSGRNIKVYSEVLERHPDFLRIHRSFIINWNEVAYINRDKALYSVKMSNGALLELSKRRTKEIFERLAGGTLLL